MPLIHGAFRKVDEKYRPKLTIVICVRLLDLSLHLYCSNRHQGKRHRTRFFPTREEDADDKANPLPGTVVDRGITSVYHFDFYLQGMTLSVQLTTRLTLRSSLAHGALHSSSKPTHYFVVHDEIGFTPDELQSLTNNISYMFARATKAVSLASPAYYAHLACERGRCYLHELLQGVQKADPAVASEDEGQIRREAIESWGKGPTGPNMKDIMFYL